MGGGPAFRSGPSFTRVLYTLRKSGEFWTEFYDSTITCINIIIVLLYSMKLVQDKVTPCMVFSSSSSRNSGISLSLKYTYLVIFVTVPCRYVITTNTKYIAEDW